MNLMSQSIGIGDGARKPAFTFSILRNRNAIRSCKPLDRSTFFSSRLKTLPGSFCAESEENAISLKVWLRLGPVALTNCAAKSEGHEE